MLFYDRALAMKQHAIDDLAKTTLAMENQLTRTHNELQVTKNLLKEEQAVNTALMAGQEWNVVAGVASAYSPYDDVSGISSEGDPSITSTGGTPGKGTIAVDPKRIPYGSELIIRYANGEVETGIADDTGGAMRQADYTLIDVYRDTYVEATRHGRRDATIFWKPKDDK